jgi:hypothetical protein
MHVLSKASAREKLVGGGAVARDDLALSPIVSGVGVSCIEGAWVIGANACLEEDSGESCFGATSV